MGMLRGLLAVGVILTGCAKIVGIDDYKLRDGAIEIDAPPDGDIDAPFGSFPNYIKASNAGAQDQFGTAMALSADGSTLVVATPLEDSNATTIGGDQTNNLATDAGAVYVFTRMGSMWMQTAYIKASNCGASDNFGGAVAVSMDGSTIAVGARFEDSSTANLAMQNNNSANSGAVYVFVRSGATYTQEAYVKASNIDGGDEFGTAVALSADGSTLAVSARQEDSNAIGINGAQTDADPTTEGADFGAVYVYVRAGGVWVQQAYVKASNTGNNDSFGNALAMSADGDTLVAGTALEDSNALNINGNQSSDAATDAGAAYVFRRVQGIWAQQAYIKASNTGAADNFGQSIAISADGDTIAVGANQEDSNSTGPGGADNNLAASSGGAYVYAQVASTWTFQTFIKPSNTTAQDQFGITVALSANGNALLIGAHLEDSAADGLDGNQADNTALDAGAVYAFKRAGTTWAQSSYVKATNSEAQDNFGKVVAIDSTGALFLSSAVLEDSAATGVGGDQASNAALQSGAVYVAQ